jgi:hypothetical protein
MGLLKKTKLSLVYFWLMAAVGQTPMQARQSIQIDSSHSAFPSASKDKALVGQTPTQAPQPIHKSFATITGMLTSSLWEYYIMSTQ